MSVSLLPIVFPVLISLVFFRDFRQLPARFFQGFNLGSRDYLLVFVMMVIPVSAGILLSLSVLRVAVLGLCGFLCGSLVLGWLMKHQQEKTRFLELTTFLLDFLAHYSVQPTVYGALKLASETAGKGLQSDLIEVHHQLAQGRRPEESFASFIQRYRHFTIRHLVMLCSFSDRYGHQRRRESLQMIEQDVQQWIEDTLTQAEAVVQMQQRMILLCFMALVVAWLSLRMLRQISAIEQSYLYQSSMMVFLFCVECVMLLSVRFVVQLWQQREEM